MTLDSLELAFLIIGAAAFSLAVLLGWRAVHLRALAPPCNGLATIEGKAKAIRFDHHFYSAW